MYFSSVLSYVIFIVLLSFDKSSQAFPCGVTMQKSSIRSNRIGPSRATIGMFDTDVIQNIIDQSITIPGVGTATLEDVAKSVVLSFAALAIVSINQVPDRLLESSTLKTLAQGTYMERKFDKLKCVYKATKDGWSAINFHEAVDGKGSGFVVTRSFSGRTFGGFNANGWRSTDDYYSSTSSFLWYQVAGGSVNQIVKLPILPGGDAAVFDYATAGPCFGASDFLIGPPRAAVMGGFAGPDAEDITKSAGSLRQCKSSIGSTYLADNGWPARGTVQLLDVEVYCID
jgi:TLD